MRATYFLTIAAICLALLLLALVAYVVRKIGPSSFRLRVALARIISFSVEMESRGRGERNATYGAESGHRPDDRAPLETYLRPESRHPCSGPTSLLIWLACHSSG